MVRDSEWRVTPASPSPPAPTTGGRARARAKAKEIRTKLLKLVNSGPKKQQKQRGSRQACTLVPLKVGGGPRKFPHSREFSRFNREIGAAIPVYMFSLCSYQVAAPSAP